MTDDYNPSFTIDGLHPDAPTVRITSGNRDGDVAVILIGSEEPPESRFSPIAIDRMTKTRQVIISPPASTTRWKLGEGPGEVRPVQGSPLTIRYTDDVKSPLIVTFDGEEITVEKLARS